VIVRRNMLNNYPYLGFPIDSKIFTHLMSDADSEVRLAVLPIASQLLPLDVFIDNAKKLMNDSNMLIRMNLVRELSMKRNNMLQPMLKEMTLDQDKEVSTEAKLGLFELIPTASAYEIFLNDYRGGLLNEAQMLRVVEMLPYLGVSAQDLALKLLDIENNTLRRALVFQLFRLKMDIAHPEIVSRLMNDNSIEVRNMIINHYNMNPDQVTKEMLNDWIKSEHENVRGAAINYISRLESDLAADYLEDLMIDDDLQIRIMAIQVFAQRRLPRYDKILEMTLHDENTEVQKQAVQLIIQLMGKEGADILMNFVTKNKELPLSEYIRNVLRNYGYNQ
jgi:HEAT repeat protein